MYQNGLTALNKTIEIWPLSQEDVNAKKGYKIDLLDLENITCVTMDAYHKQIEWMQWLICEITLLSWSPQEQGNTTFEEVILTPWPKPAVIVHKAFLTAGPPLLYLPSPYYSTSEQTMTIFQQLSPALSSYWHFEGQDSPTAYHQGWLKSTQIFAVFIRSLKNTETNSRFPYPLSKLSIALPNLL